MSRIAKKIVIVPSCVDIKLSGQKITVTNEKKILDRILNNNVIVSYINGHLSFKSKISSYKGWAQAGTARSLVFSMIVGVTTGFLKKLQLLGVGFRISLVNENALHLYLGYSHIIKYFIPKGISIECPSQTEIIIKGYDKQLVGQVAADIRSYRTPEAYKGKGIRYDNEIVRIKEAKKK
ncbi:MAG: 50S ribosomal protein L6 [Buchnera aphidicola (Nurudea yanoniella)]